MAARTVVRACVGKCAVSHWANASHFPEVGIQPSNEARTRKRGTTRAQSRKTPGQPSPGSRPNSAGSRSCEVETLDNFPGFHSDVLERDSRPHHIATILGARPNSGHPAKAVEGQLQTRKKSQSKQSLLSQKRRRDGHQQSFGSTDRPFVPVFPCHRRLRRRPFLSFRWEGVRYLRSCSPAYFSLSSRFRFYSRWGLRRRFVAVEGARNLWTLRDRFVSLSRSSDPPADCPIA